MGINAYNQYRNVSAQTAPKERLTLMLYDGAVKFSGQAILALENNEPMKLNESVRRTLDIIKELQDTLNRDYEIASNYFALYDYIIERLLTGESDRDPAALAEANSLIKEFRDMWREAMKAAKIQ
jgi:flagellar protein FliS